MKIIIEDVGTELQISYEKTFNEEQGVGFEDVYQRLMAALEGAITTMLDNVDVPDRKTFREHMYDIIDAGFGQLLKKTFPEIRLGDFDLTAAAIVKAQDEIIQEAESQGKTYEEILDKYNEIANKYIEEKRLN